MTSTNTDILIENPDVIDDVKEPVDKPKVTETNIRAFYLTFSLLSLTFTFGLVICLFFNKDWFIYLLVTYVMMTLIYLHVVNLLNLNTKSTNAFTSLKQSSIVIIYAYISIISLMITYYLLNRLQNEKKSIYSY